MAATDDHRCIICASSLGKAIYPTGHGDSYVIDCSRCSSFELPGTDRAEIPGLLAGHDDKRLLVSHFIHRSRSGAMRPKLTSDFVQRIIAHEKYPSPAQQLDNLVLYLGDSVRDPGEKVPVDLEVQAPVIGAQSNAALTFAGDSAKRDGLINIYGPPGMSVASTFARGVVSQLTLKGWQRYEELKRGKASGTRAFMAMKFGEADLDEMLEKHFKPAVALTGFTLRTVDENRKAGLIDDKLRLEINLSRFVIADLTHHNNGAYWEAGYAEGLKKPVMYTCRSDVFDHPDRKKGTHFDTNHHLTVKWTTDNPQKAVDDLKATIRMTIPEANQED